MRMNNNFIKVQNSAAAQTIASAGFPYTKETVGGKEVFVFAKVPELVAFVNAHFDKKQFFESNTLCFAAQRKE